VNPGPTPALLTRIILQRQFYKAEKTMLDKQRAVSARQYFDDLSWKNPLIVVWKEPVWDIQFDGFIGPGPSIFWFLASPSVL
jgi:hypothetical protein